MTSTVGTALLPHRAQTAAAQTALGLRVGSRLKPSRNNTVSQTQSGRMSPTGFHGASARTACCGCGGGLRAATPFRYYTVLGLKRIVETLELLP